MKGGTEMRLRCDACGRSIFIESQPYAIDKHGDALCQQCHRSAVVMLHMTGVTWEGNTFGYDDEELAS